jgi:hypothetical protein
LYCTAENEINRIVAVEALLAGLTLPQIRSPKLEPSPPKQNLDWKKIIPIFAWACWSFGD